MIALIWDRGRPCQRSLMLPAPMWVSRDSSIRDMRAADLAAQTIYDGDSRFLAFACCCCKKSRGLMDAHSLLGLEAPFAVSFGYNPQPNRPHGGSLKHPRRAGLNNGPY